MNHIQYATKNRIGVYSDYKITSTLKYTYTHITSQNPHIAILILYPTNLSNLILKRIYSQNMSLQRYIHVTHILLHSK